MSNYTPETAIVIPNLPYSNAQDVATDIANSNTAAGYVSTCDPVHRKPVWYRYTTGPNERWIIIGADDPGSMFYSPICSIWTGIPPALTQYEILTASDDQHFCSNLGGGFYFQVPVQPNTTYYFQFTNASSSATMDGTLMVYGFPAPNNPAPAGSIVIPDDTDVFPAAILDGSGAVIQFLYDFPAGEQADFIPNSFLCTQDGSVNTGVAILDRTYQRVASVDWAPAVVLGIKSDNSAFFYVVTSLGGTATLRKLATDGTEAQNWTLPANFGNGPLAVNRTGTRFYYAIRQTNVAIHAYDLTNSVALGDLHAGFPGETPWSFADGLCDAAGNVLIAYVNSSTLGAAVVRRFNPAGTVINTYTLSANTTFLNHYARNTDDASFWVWGYRAFVPVQNAYFEQIRFSDGAVLKTIGPVRIELTSGGPDDVPVGGISNSCPLLIAPFPITPSGSTPANGCVVDFPTGL